jgi:hypothetical protein
LIGRDYRARARYVLADDRGIAPDVLFHMAGDQTRPEVIERAGLAADNKPDVFSLIERRLRKERGAGEEMRCNQQ